MIVLKVQLGILKVAVRFRYLCFMLELAQAC